jgi:ribosome-associated protein
MTEAAMVSEQLEQVVTNALEDLKAVEPVMLDVRGKTPITDLMFVASGNSTQHVKAIAGNIVGKAKQAGVRPVGIEGEDAGEWVLVDLGDAVVHVMLPQVRALYRLERIWGFDADDETPLRDRVRQ